MPYYKSITDSAINESDVPTALRSGNQQQDRDFAKYQLYVRQALARGIINEKSAAKVLEGPNRRNLLEKILRFEPSGSRIMQPFIDILSLDNYFSASVAQSRYKFKQEHLKYEDANPISELSPIGYIDPLKQVNPASIAKNFAEDPIGALGAYTIGFSPSEFWKSWKSRESFTDVLGYQPADGDTFLDTVTNPDFLMGLGLDIALSPSTWLTFGIGGGLKVAAAGSKLAKAAKVTETAIGTTQKTLTMSRWGGRVYREASKELLPKLVDELETSNRLLQQTGRAEKQSMWGTQEMLQRFHEEAIPYMEKNYDRLARNVIAQDKGIASRLFSDESLVSQVERDAIRKGVPGMEQLYKETSPLHRRELGFWKEGTISKWLASSDKATYRGKFIHGVGRRFSQTWGLDSEAKLVFESFQNTAGKRKMEWERLVKRDPAFLGLTADQGRAASFILDAENFDLDARNAAGSIVTAIGEVAYDERALGAARRAKELFREMADEEQQFGVLGRERENYLAHMMKESIPFLSLTRANGIRFGAPGFAKERMLGSLGELIEATPGGEKVVETNLIKILHQRKLMSIEHVYTSRFNDHLTQAYGMPYAMINGAKNGISKQLREFFTANQGNPEVIADLDQVWKRDEVNPSRLGFTDSTNQKANRKVISWMTSETRDYDLPFVTDRLKTVPPLGETARMTILGERKEFNTNLLLENLYEGTPLAEEITPKQMANAMRQLDGKLREHGVPLRAIFPDIDVRIFGNETSKARDTFSKAISGPLELASSTEWPQWMMSNAVRWRQKIGVFTDVTKPSGEQLIAISKMMKKIGFNHDELVEYLGAKYGIDSFDKLSARMADNLQDTLSVWSGYESQKFNVNAVSLLHETLVKVEFPSPRFYKESNLPEVLEKADEAIIAAKGKVSSITDELSNLAERQDSVNARIEAIRVERAAAIGAVESDPGVKMLREKAELSNLELKRLQKEKKALGVERKKIIDEHKKKLTGYREDLVFAKRNARKSSSEDAKPIRSEIKKLVPERKIIMENLKKLVDERDAALDKWIESINNATGDAKAKLEMDMIADKKAMNKVIRLTSKDKKAIYKKLQGLRKKLSSVYKTRDEAIAAAKWKMNDLRGVARKAKKVLVTPMRSRINELGVARKTARDVASKADVEHTVEYAKALRTQSPDMEDYASFIEEQHSLKKQASTTRARRKVAGSEVASAQEKKRRAKVSAKAQMGDRAAQKEIQKAQKDLIRLRAERQKLETPQKTADPAEMSLGPKTAAASSKTSSRTSSRSDAVVARIARKLDKRIAKLEEFVGDLPDELKVQIKQPDLVHVGIETGAESPIGYDTFGPTPVKGLDPWQGFGGGQWYLPESIANLIEDVKGRSKDISTDKDILMILSGYDWVQNFFKAPLMAPWLAFYKRNAVTNTMLAYTKCGLALLHPTHLTNSVSCLSYYIANNGSDLAKTVVKSGAKSGAVYGALGGAAVGAMQAMGEDGSILDIPGTAIKGTLAGAGLTAATGLATKSAMHGAMKLGKLDKLANRKIVIGKGPNALKLTVAQAVDEMEKRGVFWTHVSKDIFPSGGASRASEVIGMSDMFRAGELVSEIPTRMMLFLTVAGETGSLGLAAKAVKDYLFDFASMTNFERRVMRRMIPFYSWMKHAMTISFKSAIEQPGRVTTPFKFARDASADYDPADTPDWLSERMRIVSRDTQGNLIVKTNLGLAQEDTAELLEGIAGLTNLQDPEKSAAALQLLSRGPFGITSALEALFNKDTFSGRQIHEEPDSRSDYTPAAFRSAPEWIQRAVDYRKVGGAETINPTFAWIMGELPYSRFINSVKQVYEVDTDPKTGKDGNPSTPHINFESLARTILAERLYKYDPKTQTYYRNKKALDQMTLALKRMGVIKQYTVTGKTWKTTKRPALPTRSK